MRSEIICVGTELLLGKANTNVSFLSEKLAHIGLKVGLATTVNDDRAEMIEVLKNALGRSQLLIITGGLGPTFDDITRETVAEVLGKKLVFDRPTFQSVAAFFAKRNMEMLKSHEKQALLIESATAIPNEMGTAPGQIIFLETNKEIAVETIVLLPGPPTEMQPMMTKTVLPLLKEKYGTGITKVERIHTIGISESRVEEAIKEIVEREYKLEGGSLCFSLIASPGMVDIVISGSGKNELLSENLIRKTKNEIKEKLGAAVYGENDVTLSQVLGQLLMKKRMTIGVAESCTGGLVSKMITDVAGSSLYFKGGITAYSNTVKQTILGIKKEDLEKEGAVSSSVALSMAKNIRTQLRTHIGLGITGIAGPGGGTVAKPVGLVYTAIVTDNYEKCFQYMFADNRQGVREKAALFALEAVRRMLLE